ncbi:MAG TPA: sigma-70 family RNA polymerase sigma factor [Candidatus Hydrogenedentes bacterium]|nr:sigma-70 family RNA polymerase sigma factor [Candidatus Hydrogenedentota bacterium]
MFSFSGMKKDAAAVRRVFQGDASAYQHIVEKYQPMVYAIALAQTGSVYLADRVVVETFEQGYERLFSLTDARKLGLLLASIAQQIADQLSLRRVPNWNKARTRDTDVPPVDLKWVQNELIEPLEEDLGSFTPQERMGILLNAFCNYSAKTIAGVLKIDRKEAQEDLSRTRENIERALLKEVVKTLKPEVDNKERLLHILAQVGGEEVAAKAARDTRTGKPKFKIVPMLLASSAVLVVCISIYFAYILFNRIQAGSAPGSDAAPAPNSSEANAPADVPPDGSKGNPANYSLQGRVVDERFITDGVAGVLVEAGGQQDETDSYGGFEIKGISRGRHDVTVRVGDTVVARGIRMHTEEHNEPVTIGLDEHIPARYRFQGRVFDRNTGRSITQFEVATCKELADMLQPYLLKYFREQTNASGLLYDRFLTLGDYTMYVRARGYAPLPVQFTIDENWTGDQVYEFPLYRAVRFMGSVYGANELSIAGVSIVPRQGTAYGVLQESVYYGHTNSMGRFDLYTLPVGLQSFLFMYQEQVARAIVELEPGKTTEVRVQFPRKGSITGDITLRRRPAKFEAFYRNVGGIVDLTKNVKYLSPGQYEVMLTPEPVVVLAGVAPEESDRWFRRQLELKVSISHKEPTWLDFNFVDGPAALQGSINAQGGASFYYVEVSYDLKEGRELFYYDLGAATSFQLQNLPAGAGTVTLYGSATKVSPAEFDAARLLMKKQAKPFKLEGATPYMYLDFSL